MRIDKIINDHRPKEQNPQNLRELYEWEATEEGQKELAAFYDPDRNLISNPKNPHYAN